MKKLKYFIQWLMMVCVLLIGYSFLMNQFFVYFSCSVLVAFILSPIPDLVYGRSVKIPLKVRTACIAAVLVVGFSYFLSHNTFSVDEVSDYIADTVTESTEASTLEGMTVDEFRDNLVDMVRSTTVGNYFVNQGLSLKEYFSSSDSDDIDVVTVSDVSFQEAQLERVVDGDTLIVIIDGTEVRVRLIGINTPESVHPDDTKNTEEGEDASSYLKEYLADVSTVFLQTDVSDTDQYGRALRYVWLEIPTNPFDVEEVRTKMLNGVLVNERIAEPVAYEPDILYKDIFEQIYSE